MRRLLICRRSTTWGYSSTCECMRRAFLTTALRVGSGRSSRGCWYVRPRSSAGRGTRSVSGPPFNEQVDAFPPRAGGWRLLASGQSLLMARCRSHRYRSRLHSRHASPPRGDLRHRVRAMVSSCREDQSVAYCRLSEAGFLQLLRQGPPSDVGDVEGSEEVNSATDVGQ